MKNKKTRKIWLIITAAAQIFLVSAYPSLAIHIPSANEMAKDLEKRYHINTGSVRNASHSFNVASNKGDAPQVMLFFSPSDPKQGERLTAEASPLYFSTPKESMYYTWYLKRKDCFKGDVSDTSDNGYATSLSARQACDLDNDGEITYNDWKIEAHRTIANNGYDTTKADYSNNGDVDDDGYLALWGGDDRDPRLCGFNNNYTITNLSNRPNECNYNKSANYAYCYIHDFRNGINYELNDNGADADFDCPAGTTAKCAKNNELFCSDGTTNNEYLVCSDIEESPYCSSGQTYCFQGTPVCAENITEYTCNVPPASYSSRSCATLYGTAPIACTTSSNSNKGRNMCRHLFPDYNNFSGTINHQGFSNSSSTQITLDNNDLVGDGKFTKEEEVFWYTDPNDPDTADLGKKDEEYVTGLGVNTFNWNYMLDDQVGVAVEGSSMIATQHAGPGNSGDASAMIMWAFPKNNCRPTGTSSYTEEVKGYPVRFPTTNRDLNECIYDNMVDPREGGQPTNISASLSYFPENPLNDESTVQPEKIGGDTLVVQASSTNTDQESANVKYDWRVEIARGGIFNSGTTWDDITNSLVEHKLITGPVSGNNLESLSIRMNLNDDTLNRTLSDYITNGMGYLRVKALVSENFGYQQNREGKADVIVKFNSSGEKIRVYMVWEDKSGIGKLDINENVFDGQAHPICQDLETEQITPICYTIKNDILGVKVENPVININTGQLKYKNFSWTLNGKPLVCNGTISGKCDSGSLDNVQTNYNFFPTPGDPGTKYILNLTATNVETGETINLNRTFQVIDPFIKIASSDESVAWPKMMGEYSNLQGDTFIDTSDTVLETAVGSSPVLRAEIHPAWLGTYLNTEYMQTEWQVDGVKVAGTYAPNGYPDPFNSAINWPTETISLSAADKDVGGVYNVSLKTIFQLPLVYRQTLFDLWGISQLDTTQKYMEDSVQIEVFAAEDVGMSKPKSLLASFFSNLPGQVTFLLRILLTISVIILTTGVVFSLTPEPYENKNTYY